MKGQLYWKKNNKKTALSHLHPLPRLHLHPTDQPNIWGNFNANGSYVIFQVLLDLGRTGALGLAAVGLATQALAVVRDSVLME